MTPFTGGEPGAVEANRSDEDKGMYLGTSAAGKLETAVRGALAALEAEPGQQRVMTRRGGNPGR